MKFPASVLASVFLFVAETTAALYLSSTYRSGGDRMWQALTLFFSLMPCALVQLTLLFVHRDLSRDRPLVLLLHLLQLGPLFRCFEVFCIYCQSGHNEEPYVSITKKRQMPKNGFSEEIEKEVGQAEGKLFTHRSAFSRASVIQAFLGSAPQLTLQLYISILEQTITVGRKSRALGRSAGTLLPPYAFYSAVFVGFRGNMETGIILIQQPAKCPFHMCKETYTQEEKGVL
ncbi:Membrane transport protein XK [Sciurus carolinensis]|uniref:XK-related protein n=1 Tax=Sciurus carolinensis TaxID=30640 RepID=A0AA41MF87_SCICA|nr:Membrane transport protein XK [Sciurus carolinensis]